MTMPIDILFRDIKDDTKNIETRTRHFAEKLPLIYQRIEFCKITIEETQKRKLQGKIFKVSIELGVPGKHLIANHNFHENLYTAMHDAFSAIRRQLEEYSHKQKNKIKKHSEEEKGFVVRLYGDYGFIEDNLHNEYYFNSDSVVHSDFDHLSPGVEVTFLPGMGPDGYTAMKVSAERAA